MKTFSPIHPAQVLTYLRLLDLPQGLLLNFNVLRVILNRRSSRSLPLDDVVPVTEVEEP